MRLSETLARRWLASKHWGGWRVGMQSQLGWLCIDEGVPPDHRADWGRPAPDLDHPGTRAFLLEDVRAAHGIDWAQIATLMTRSGVHGYRVTGTGGDAGDTEAEALIVALEAAP